MLAGKKPSSQRVTEQLRASGHAGILAPSFVPGPSADDVNLVLWDWGSTLPRKVEVFDPSSRLPTDQASWPHQCVLGAMRRLDLVTVAATKGQR